MAHPLIQAVDKALLSISTIIAILMSIFVFLSSVMRYLVGAPFSFTENIVGLLFIVMVFIAMGSVTMRRAHIEVDIVRQKLAPRARRVSLKLSNLITAFFFGYLCFLSWDYFMVSYDLGAKTAESRMVLWPWVFTLLLGCAFALVATIAQLFRSKHDT